MRRGDAIDGLSKKKALAGGGPWCEGSAPLELERALGEVTKHGEREFLLGLCCALAGCEASLVASGWRGFCFPLRIEKRPDVRGLAMLLLGRGSGQAR